MSRVLITGGAGFIGSHLALQLSEMGQEVIVMDDVSVGTFENLRGFSGEIVQGNVADGIPKVGTIDFVYHLAAITDPRYPDDERLLNVNLKGFEHALQKAISDRGRFIYASSAAVYGNSPYPQKEGQLKDIRNAYALSKLICDERALHLPCPIPIIGLRYFNVFGPGEEHKGRAASMIFHVANALRKGEKIHLFKHGEQCRDHIYVKDVVRANILAMNATPGIYNVGTGRAISFNELVTTIANILHCPFEIEYVDMPFDVTTYQHYTKANIHKAKDGLKFLSWYSFEEALIEYLGKSNGEKIL